MRHLSTPASSTNASTLQAYLQVVRRRRVTIAIALVIVPIAALFVSLRQHAQYQASAQVLLSSQDLANQLTGTPTYNNTPADRAAQTQADLARVPAVAQSAIEFAHIPYTAGAFLAHSAVVADSNADLLTFSFTSDDSRAAAVLATAYARAYVRYRLRLDTAPIEAALAEVQTQIAKLPAGSLRNSLEEKATQLRTLAALKTANASVVRAAGSSSQVAPRTKRNVAFGLVLGLFLGVGLAFLQEALDTRVRSADVLVEQLRLPLLARLPAPPKRVRAENRLVMFEEPLGLQAEAFRMLRTNTEFASLGKDVRCLMVTSAMEQEGKSTTLANLAIAQARAGRHVVLVDLDLRRPFVDRFFSLQGSPGITQVAIGASSLESCLVQVPLGELTASEVPTGSASTCAGVVGTLEVLTSGAIPPDPGEFAGTARLTEILEQLKARADVVLIDAPPLFHVGDALTLSAKVDAVVVVANLDKLRRPMLAELNRQLDTMPAVKLGVVVTGSETSDSFSYGYYYTRAYAAEPVGARPDRNGG